MRLSRVATLDPPGSKFEIVKYHAATRLFAGTDPVDRSVDVMRAESLNPPKWRLIRRVPVQGTPTSAAFSPDGEVLWAVTADDDVTRRGKLLRVDMQTFEATNWAVGFNPDSLAASPDGRWVIIANEARRDDTTPGSIGLLDVAARTYSELPGLDEALGLPLGTIEPEYVAVDEQSRFAAVGCQENDAVVLVDLQSSPPRIAGRVMLTPGAQPDGVDVLGDLLAVAEEHGEHVSVYRIDAANFTGALLARVDVRPLVDPERPDKSRQPESVKLFSWRGRTYCAVGIERGGRALCLDLSRPEHPTLVGHDKVGDRPEGLIVIPDEAGPWVVTADEGKKDERGTVTFTRLLPK